MNVPLLAMEKIKQKIEIGRNMCMIDVLTFFVFFLGISLSLFAKTQYELSQNIKLGIVMNAPLLPLKKTKKMKIGREICLYD
tara:strand:+ start:241 stop:486 length:246 start_codon:yes stop_codon:yes gene_type:complete